MSNGQFGFLPWMRQGIANKIAIQDNFADTGDLQRAHLDVEVSFTGGSLTKPVQLVGPGDITGIDQRVIIRTEPRLNTFNFEDNYFPFIEFYEEDFPWRYTPANANNKHQLRPWLALIVLKDSEFTLEAPRAEGLPLVLNISAPLSHVLHPHDEHWIWAHVQANSPNNAAISGVASGMPTYIENLKKDLQKDPNVAFSRLMCSRKLEPETSYTAFLVPSFDTGRLAGLDHDPSAVHSLKAAWDLTGLVTYTDPNLFPVYYQWRFGTSALGDFETLARALQPREMDPALGGRKMDITGSGMGLEHTFGGSSTVPLTVQMEGALMPPSFVPEPAQNLSASTSYPGSVANTSNLYAPYSQRLKNILNLSGDIKSTAFTITANPYFSNLTFQPPGSTQPAGTTQDDPVILPPVYGQWHADVQHLDAATPMWVQELNIDSRYRAAAGLGSLVVKENKSSFLEAAWQQVGDVLVVNEKIAKARLAIEASKRIYQKHLIGDIRTTGLGITDSDRINSIVKIATPALKKLTVTSLTSGASAIVGKTAAQAAFNSPMTDAAVDSGFRKVTRNRSAVVKTMDPTQTVLNKQLISNMNTGAVAVSKPVLSPAAAVAATVLFDGLTGIVSSNASNAGSALMAIPTVPSVARQIYNTSYQHLKVTIATYNARQLANTPVSVTLNAAGYVQDITGSLNPADTIADRVKKSISLTYDNALISTDFKPIMAYPILDNPMYYFLENISTEYLLPNLGQYPNNTITLLEPNYRFLEAYMAGLNHEFAKELLWQEYPTDQAGSYFRQFWDVNDTLKLSTTPGYMYDIDMMHQWTQHLGGNHIHTRHNNASYLVLLIRGDLLKKYPDTLIYAQKAVGAAPTPLSPTPRTLATPTYTGGLPDTSSVRFPIFKASLQPDVVLLGFDLDKTVAIGNGTATNPGWFFVLTERPGQKRFKLDEVPDPPASLPAVNDWNNLSWGHMRNGVTNNIYTANISSVDPSVGTFNGLLVNTTNGTIWNNNSNAAAMASIMFKQPVTMAIHADDMIL